MIGVTTPSLQGNGATSRGHRTPGALLSSHPAQTELKPVSLISQSNFYSCSGYLVLLNMKSSGAGTTHLWLCFMRANSRSSVITPCPNPSRLQFAPLITSILPFKYVIGPSSDATALNNGIKRYKPEFLQPTGFHRFMLRRSNNQENCGNLCFMRQYKGYDVGISRAGGKITCRVISRGYRR